MNFMWLRKVTGALALTITIISCSDDSDCSKIVSQDILDLVNEAQLAIDNAIIDDYILANSITDVQEVNGIKYVITEEGSGLTPCLENTVSVIYKGKLMSNGNTFDSTLSPRDFPLNQLILGWQLSFPTFTRSTKATIFIPSGYGYGPTGFPPQIPANANLIFDIELVNVR